jgi:nucleotide-binding universal stress UspA family protein
MVYRKILIPLDGSELAECVLPHIENIAKGSGVGEIILFRVCEPPVILADYPANLRTQWEDHVRQETAHIQQQCRLYLDDIEKKLREAGYKVATEAGLGNAAELIVDYAARNGVDLIVMASHGRSGITRWAYGSTADKVLQASQIPVLIVKAKECQPGKQGKLKIRNPKH